MSLFEDDRYVYRDTFFIHFEKASRPTGAEVKSCIETLGEKYEFSKLRESDGKFESVTIRSPHDSSAMDITIVEGEEVLEQVSELLKEFRTITLSGDDHKKLQKLDACDARFDIFHFEHKSGGEAEEEMLDPGGLLLVMERLAAACDGVGLDPQSKTLL
ncbi:MAG: hypothetical protein ACI87E_000081 [Mariniblastus sp.]